MGKIFVFRRVPSCYLLTIFSTQLASDEDDDEVDDEDENDGGVHPDHSIFGRKPKLLLQLMTDNCITPSTPATPIRAEYEFWSLNGLKCSNTKNQRKIYLVQITLQLWLTWTLIINLSNLDCQI